MKTLTFLLMVIGMAGCDVPKEPQALRIALGEDLRSFDPLVGVDAPSCHLLLMLGEGLMRTGKEGPEPGIAKSYTVSSDGTKYTFYLRKSTWGNGDPLTAADFENSWKRAATPEFSAGAHYFYCIRNFPEAAKGQVGLDEIGVKAKDSNTLEVELRYPVPQFVSMTTLTVYFPTPPASTLPTNGPFYFSKWEPNKGGIFRKNPLYWDSESVHLEKICVEIIPDPNTLTSLFEKEEIDWCGSPFHYLPNDALAALDQRYDLKFKRTSMVSWMFVNTKAPPFNNKKVRQAFSYTIDRGKIAKTLLAPRAMPHTGALPACMALSKKPFFKDADSFRGRQLLKEGLDELGLKECPPVTLYCANSELKYQLSQALQSQWKEGLKVSVKIQKEDWKVFFERMAQGDYQLGSLSWFSLINDPVWYLTLFKDENGGLNRTRWEHPQYQAFLDQALQTADPQERDHRMAEAESLLIEEMPVIPLFNLKDAYLQNTQLKGVFFSELGKIDFKNAYFK